ncbi:trypsin-like peptidase domain-containing protein [Streptomyces sp. V3I7]|uniref:effector-associated domain 2-containing protein n=1 Tax=Streptomyces sp. V3I7 TaxID=3042278 RepID=UPI002786C686|nr:trypsin-like peptidase domain-containing protein [Streptomyces sp. V3I7]MDQ0992346.1 S1-C subfamily serine protease [Streptomyces sp. V3I7]
MGDLAGSAALGRVRVLSPQGVVRGAGILVAPDVVLTCAHVVAAAASTGQAGPVAGAPRQRVLVDIPGRPEVAAGEAGVVADGWFPGPLLGGPGGDLAVLRVSWSPPNDVVPATLGPCGEPDRREVSVFGHPRGVPDGLWSSAVLAGRGGRYRHWVQLERTTAGGAGITPGFSGGGVWDPARRTVVGMVTAAYTDPQAKVAWMLPVEAMAELWPPLASWVRRPEPWPPLTLPSQRRPAELPSDRDQFALADALLNVPQIDEDGPVVLRRLLPPPIRRGIRDNPRPRLQAFHIVQACVDHRGGRQALLNALRLIDDESEPARAAADLVERLWPADPGGEAR